MGKEVFENAGHLLGKKVSTYDPGISCTIEELRIDLAKFDRLEILRAIADLSEKVFRNGRRQITQGLVPITDDLLLFLAKTVLEVVGIDQIPINEKNLALLLRKAHSVWESMAVQNISGVNDVLLIMAYRDFQFQEKLINSVGRTVYMYSVLWDQVSTIRSNWIFEKVLGVSMENILTHLFVLIGSSDGYFFRKGGSTWEVINKAKGFNTSESSERKFLDWCSATAGTIQNYDGKLDNPLKQYPIIETGVVPPGASDPVFLIVSKRCLYFKFTYNLYFDFCTAFDKGGRNNLFKVQFGKVFEAYVGVLLRNSFRSWTVTPEIKYRDGKNTKKTVDWFVRKAEKLIIVEVKQSSVFLETKQTGSFDRFKVDVGKTVVKGIEQLNLTESILQKGTTPELASFNGVTRIKKVCVVADPLYFSNLLLLESLGEPLSTHVVNISDFEDLLALQEKKEGLFYLLDQKENDPALAPMDFKEFLIERYGKKHGAANHPIVLEGYRHFVEKYGLGKT